MRGWSPWHVSQEWQNPQRPKGQQQRLSFQEWQYWLDWGLPEDASGSVSDKAEEFAGFAESGAAEVVVGDLVWKLKRFGRTRDQSVEPEAAASYPKAMS